MKENYVNFANDILPIIDNHYRCSGDSFAGYNFEWIGIVMEGGFSETSIHINGQQFFLQKSSTHNYFLLKYADNRHHCFQIFHSKLMIPGQYNKTTKV